ncbi:MAG TPA: hypothetical protein VFD03_10445 [Clostridia bacterium]|nr:hypothetical protein [Clostridia bacterium]
MLRQDRKQGAVNNMVDSKELIRECNMMYGICKARILLERAESRTDNDKGINACNQAIAALESERSSVIERIYRGV